MAIDPLLALRFEEEFRQALKAAPPFPAAAAKAYRDSRRELVELRRVAGTPVTFGVVGEFNAGKTSVIGALLGDPELLPVHNRPATAQVSALSLSVGEPGQPTRLGDRAVVEFFDHQEVADCLDYLIRRLAEEIAHAEPGRDLARLEAIRTTLTGGAADSGPAWLDPAVWQDYDDWARSTLWTAENRLLRLLAMEIREFSDALFQLAPALFGDTAALSTDDALDVTCHGRATLPGERYPVHRSYDEPFSRHDLEAHVRPDGMAAVAPLIRRVDYAVTVPPGIWGPADAGVLLLDFPGLGAERSRDAFLCGSQLRNVETILVVGRGDQLGSQEMSRFYGLMRAQNHSEEKLANAILVAINKWDTVPVPDLPADQAAHGAAVQDLSDSLSAAATAAGMLLGEQLNGLQLLSVRTAAAVPEPEQHTGADAELIRKRRRWAALAARIKATDPEHHWARDLTGYGVDGGLAQLRRLLAEHIDTHGARQKRDTVAAQSERARHAGDLLLALAMTHAIGEHSEEARQLAQRFEALRGAIDRLQADLHRRQNPVRVRDGEGGAVLERLASEATEQVYRWPEWSTLLNSVENGQIAKRTPISAEELEILKILSPEEQRDYLAALRGRQGGADTTADFYTQYTKTYETLRTRAADELTTWWTKWAGGYEDLFTELHDWLHDPGTKARLTGLFGYIEGTPPAARLIHVQIPTRRDKLLEAAVGKARRKAGAGPSAEKAADAPGFPRRTGQALPWHSDYPDDASGAVRAMENSQYTLARLRYDIVDALRDEVEALFTRMLTGAATELARTVEQSAPLVPDSIQISTMIAQAARAAGDQAAADAAEDGLATLRGVLRRWKEAS
ncbi:hypothetical protein ACIQGZ_10850 [Streptomyces sp. NPDC092296]|uniref:hypothetical protein n=1 Tax=Streptomyces sp. NPDC092296 TaxID=3366012 RepID=UPI00381A0623